MAEYHISHEGPVTILEITGRIEPDNWQELNAVFKKILETETTRHLLVDLASLEYTASAGFRELFMVGRALSRKGGHLAVCSLQGEVKRVFDLAGFATAYPIFDDRTSGVASFPQN